MARARTSSKQTLELLFALMDQSRHWRYGYDLSKETGLKSGTLYPILMRLSERELVESKWEPATKTGRPPRHLYRLSPDGVAYAKVQLANAGTPALSVALKGNPA